MPRSLHRLWMPRSDLLQLGGSDMPRSKLSPNQQCIKFLTVFRQ